MPVEAAPNDACVESEVHVCFESEVNVFCELSDIEPFSGGTVTLAGHPSEPQVAVCIQQLGKILIVCTKTQTGQILSDAMVSEPFEDGPSKVAFNQTGDSLLVVLDNRLMCCTGACTWFEVFVQEEFIDCECLSVDGNGRVLIDAEPLSWLLPCGDGKCYEREIVDLDPLPPEPPKATDGEMNAVLRRATWEATTVNLASALALTLRSGAVFFYDRESRSAHYLEAGSTSADELSVRQVRSSQGQVVHMESDLPEDGCSCTSPNGGMFVVGIDGTKDSEDKCCVSVWSFSTSQLPVRTRLHGFRCRPAQLDAVAADTQGRLFLCVVEKWPDQRTIYCVTPVNAA
mmetsp:Transcript_95262/g.188775  ORF Transcript_95262/g.188775 Transcript_95262/m.188775 type:complete len:344 (+) Transcript_95262:36-1067(+)